MKRIHLFEFEDQPWFPNWIRQCMTNMLIAVHRIMGTSEHLAELLARALKQSGQNSILDLCSGSGGPMLEVMKLLKKEHGFNNLQLTLSDLYPNQTIAASINAKKDGVSYQPTPVDATTINAQQEGLRTMICSLHHMKPDLAQQILRNAQESNQAICIYEISDNSMPPSWLWWIALPFNFIFALIVGLFTRPFTLQQFVFTYLIPIIPFFFAWDGAVSNVRTYTLSDLDELLTGLPESKYHWEKGTIAGKGGNKLYLLGMPEGVSKR